MVARISTLIFMGEKVCRDEDWINVSVNYTIDAFMAARELRRWPSILRPIVQWFIPATQKLRKHLSVARSIVKQEIKAREIIRPGKLPLDESPRTHVDALDWMEELSATYNLPYDRSLGQVGLSMAAIHTTSNLLTNIAYDLAAYPEYIQPLRDEIRAIASEDGNLKKTSLLKLKLMDSVMKESQRVHPVSMSKSIIYQVNTVHSQDQLP
jgi:cytochrome P450